MMKKVLSIILTLLMMISILTLTGCNVAKKENEESKKNPEDVYMIDDNGSYFVKINGTKFVAGDKIADVSSVGLKQKEKNLSLTIPKNRYLLSEAVVDENEKEVCKFTPLNVTDQTITNADAVIGGFEVGGYNYNDIPLETLAYTISVCGGIALGSSYDDMIRVFGEPDFKNEQDTYTVYTYSKGYKGYDFIVDGSGKISKIEWRNYSFNN